MVLITLATISGTFSFISGTLTFGQWACKLKTVPKDIRQAVEDLTNIQKDLNEARELRSLKFDMNSKERITDRKYVRLNNAIKQLEITVQDCWRTIHAQAVDSETRNGRVGFLHCFDWVLNGKDTYMQRQVVLSRDHNRLMGANRAVEGLPDISSSSPEFLAPPPYSPAVPRSDDYLEVLSPSQRRILRGKSTELIGENESREVGETSLLQNSAVETESYSSSNMTISRKMRKLWDDGDSTLQNGVLVETTEHNVEDEYVPSIHHRKRHRK